MAVTTEHYYTGNASTTSFAYTFPYYKTSDIKVTWDGVLKTEGTHYDVTGTNIVFKTSPTDYTPANNVVVRIYRDTDVDTSKATFAAGNSIRATDLNNNQIQLLYSAQERQSSGTVNANISNKAEIEVSKLKDGSARQLLQTAANGDDVEWTSNVDVPGTLDVTGVVDFDSNLTVDGTSTLTGNVTVGGTVDGRDVAADGTKLDGIETAATQDQTAAEIRVLVEAANDSNVFTDADHAKLNNIEAGANVNQNAFSNVAVSGQTTVAADAVSDTLTFAAGSNVTLTTNASNDTVTIASTDTNTNQNAFSNIAVSGQTTVAADTTTDTLELAAGSNITLTTDASNDKVTITASGGEVTVKDEGSALSTAASTLNFVGTGVTATGTGAEKTITIPGSTGSALTIKEEGTALSTAATSIDFVGTNVTASGTGADKTITITGGGEITVQDEGNALSTAATTLNFVGAGVVASGTGASKTITISGSGGAGVTTDFQYLELKAHNNTSGAFAAGSADYELVTKGTTTAVSPTQAAALLISIGGVIQESNTGTSIGSNDGFCIDGSSIHFGANLTAHPEYILYLKGAGSVSSYADNSVTLAAMAHGTQGDILYYGASGAPTLLTKGTNGHYLKQGTSNAPEWAAVPSGGISDVVSDTTPQLGGNLDVNGKNILFADSGSASDDRLVFGAGTDLEIYHDGAVGNIIRGVGVQFQTPGTNVGNSIYIQNFGSGYGTNQGFLLGLAGADPFTDAYIWNYENKPIVFGTNNTERMKIAAGGAVTISGLTYPTSDGSANQVLKTDGSGALSWVTQSSGGGATGTDYNDNVKVRFGTGNDLEIYHDGSHSRIKDTGTGYLIINTDTGVLIKNGADDEGIAYFTPNGAVELMYDGVKKFETTSAGVSFSGDTFMPDGEYAHFGTGNDLYIGHSGSHSYITDSGTGALKVLTNELQLVNAAGNEYFLSGIENGAVNLYYDNSKKFETISSGTITSGHSYLLDNNKVILGSSDDLQLYHDATNSHIYNKTGALYLSSDADIYLYNEWNNENFIRCIHNAGVELYWNGAKMLETTAAGVTVIGDIVSSNDQSWQGSGGNAGAMFWDKSGDALKFVDNTSIKFGTGADFQIYHSGSNNTFNAVNDHSFRFAFSGTNQWEIGGGANPFIKGNDGRQLLLGDSSDLQIYHATQNWIKSGVDGTTLHIDHDITQIRNHGGTEVMAKFIEDGAVELYYNNAKKAETKSGGWQIHGTCYVDFENDVGGYGGQWNDASTNGTFIQFQRTGSNAGYISHSNTTASYNTTGSDRNLKENFEDWTDSYWDAFKNSNPQKFNFKTDPEGTPKSRGYIAQDLTEFFPEAYHKTGQEHYYFNPGGMVPYLMKTLQEAIIKIDNLETKVAALEAA